MDAKVRALLEMLSVRRSVFLGVPELGEDAPSGARLCAILDALIGGRPSWCACEARWDDGEWLVILCGDHQRAEASADAWLARVSRMAA